MLIPNISLILLSDVGKAPKNLPKFLQKNFDKVYQGLIDIKEQNQLHIWNQHEKYYQIPYCIYLFQMQYDEGFRLRKPLYF